MNAFIFRMTKRGVDDSLIICLLYYFATSWEMNRKYKLFCIQFKENIQLANPVDAHKYELALIN